MRTNIRRMTFALVCATALLPGRAFAQGAMLKLDQLDALSVKAKETVNVTLDQGMLQMATSFLGSSSKSSASGNSSASASSNTTTNKSIGDLVSGLKAIYVRSYEFDKEGQYSPQDVAGVRAQLKAPWTPMVTTHDPKESVDIYMWRENGEMGGLAILVAEPKELTVVNIVGKMDLSALAAMGGSFGIPRGLGIPGVAPNAGAPPPPPAPPAPGRQD